jgi:hypothetical protein
MFASSRFTLSRLGVVETTTTAVSLVREGRKSPLTRCAIRGLASNPTKLWLDQDRYHTATKRHQGLAPFAAHGGSVAEDRAGQEVDCICRFGNPFWGDCGYRAALG